MAEIGLQSERGAVCNLVSEIAISGGGEEGQGAEAEKGDCNLARGPSLAQVCFCLWLIGKC